MDRELGELAVRAGWLSSKDLGDVLAEHELERAAGNPSRTLAAILLDRGHLTSDQLMALAEQIRTRGGAQAALSPESPTPLPSGPVCFGKYTILRELGRGARGVVYEAVDPLLDRKVALKVVRPHPQSHVPELERERELFVREARLAANLPRHPHIVGVYEAGVHQKCRYIAMELVDGKEMTHWLAGAGLREKVAVLRDVARAVQLAHEQGVVHRDLKPQNIIVDAKGEPHVTDFGTAKSIRQDPKVRLTATGFVVGTVYYMSPEQAQGSAELDGRADVYSIGVMLYEILAGRPPFVADSPVSTLMQALTQTPRRPSAVAAKNAPREAALERICMKAIARNPEDRHASARELAGELDAWLGGRRGAVRPGLLAPAAVAAVAILAAGAFAFFRPDPALPAVPGLTHLGRNDRGFGEFRNEADGSVMVLVPEGEFVRGSNAGKPNEQPRSGVYLDAYLIDKTEVTVGQFRRFVEATAYVTEAERQGWAFVLIDQDPWFEKRRGASWRSPAFAQEDNHPVTCVSWEDASAYCRWAGKRLPTEAEWEKAARGTDGRAWPWGDAWDPSRLNAGFRAKKTTPVGSFPEGASPYGLLDAAGNVSELCADWLEEGYYGRGEVRNPRGPAAGEMRVLRGGSWISSERVSTPTRMSAYTPDFGINNCDGFRGARGLR